MSYHIFPAGGGQQHLPGGRRRRLNLAHLEPLQNMSVLNTGWNETIGLSLDSTLHMLPPALREAHWESPSVNVLPTAASQAARAASPFPNKPFGSTTRHKPLPRTPLQSVGRRSEHWYSDPIHGVFSASVAEVPNRWATSNRNVFTARPGVPAPAVPPGVLARVASASQGSLYSAREGFTKPQLSRSQHCWDRLNGD